MSEIRTFTACDAPAVAALFHRVFLRRVGTPAPALASRLAASFLEHPWSDPELPSRVSVGANGAIDGFIGVYAVRMVLGDRPIRAAVASSHMVDGAEANPLTGARLVRSVLNGPQDLSLSETANALSLAMWERLGAQTLGAYSLDWIRLLRPVGAAIAVLGRRFRPAAAAKPMGALADRLLARTRLHDGVLARTKAPPAAQGRAAGEDEFIEAALQLSAGYGLRPAWQPPVLRWLLSQAAEKDRYGPLYPRLVHGPRGNLLGAYLVYARAGQIARVLQVLAGRPAAGAVLDDLFAFVGALGGVAVRGRSEPRLSDALCTRRCIFLHQGAALAHARSSELLDALRGSPALITGLAGETWSPLIGNAFHAKAAPARRRDDAHPQPVGSGLSPQ